MKNEIKEYLAYICEDYKNWSGDISTNSIHAQMYKEFCVDLTYETGSKYIKVITRNSVHSFIVIKADNKFKVGDILKAASWKAPAKNFRRGNIFEKNFSNVRWNGCI